MTPPQPQPGAPEVLQAPSLASLPWLRHAFSTRLRGVSTVYQHPNDLNLGFTREDDRQTVENNRRLFLQTLDPTGAWPLLTTRQIHSALTLPVTSPDQPLDPADGLATTLPGIVLGTLTADCVPVLIADPIQRAIAVFHAGWRGTAARILEHGVQLLRDQYASKPKDLVAAIGPSIGPCCYQVGEEVHSRFHESFAYAPTLFHADNLDLWQANRRQLEAAGLPSARITTLRQCTACARTPARPPTQSNDRLFFSHRAEQGVTGRMMTAIAVVPSQ